MGNKPSLSGEPQADRADLLDRLREAAASVEVDDLTTLAKMHGWCEALATQCRPDGPQPDAALHEAISRIGSALEAIILAEADDPLATIRQINDQLAALVGEPGPSDDTPAPGETPAAGSQDGSDDLAPPAAQATASEDPSTSPASTDPQDGQAPYESQPLFVEASEMEFLKAFVEEAREHIEAIEAAVLQVERHPDDRERIDDLFRPFHTIKGMAGFLNLRDINTLTHEAETLLDQGRKGQRRITPGVIDLILATVDILKAQVAELGKFVASPHDGPIAQPPVGEMIDRLRAVVAGRLDPDAASPVGAPPAGAPEPAPPSPSEPPAAKESPAPAPAAASATPPAPASRTEPATRSAADQSIRIDTAKLDALVDMVGELVIAQTQVNANRRVQADPRLAKDVDQVTKIVRDVQELAMSMRMIPIGPTFQRMARLVRDVSRRAGKRVELVISGEDTELDKTVIQKIGDPLVHMVRNAVDHGIEPPDVRRAAGKPEVGQVRLAAFHEGGNIVIQISDDGQGLDPEKLIAKAVEKGILKPGEEISDHDAFHLIFAPGFSTAEKVTDISGRGVGMDVVRRNIEELRGKVEIASEKGRGSTFSIRLPLTLAIIDGMVVRVGSERFIIPTLMIEQALRPTPDQITSVQQRGEVVMVRGRLIPLIQLGQLFGFCGRIDPSQAMVVVCQCHGSAAGLVVNELIGQQQVVIKSLGPRFEQLEGISGAAILGDGRVGLILEISGILAVHNRYGAAATTDDLTPTADTAPDADTATEPQSEAAQPAAV